MAKLDDFENSSVVWENKVLPSGEYKFELVKTNSKETKSGFKQYTLQLKCVEGEYKGSSIFPTMLNGWHTEKGSGSHIYMLRALLRVIVAANIDDTKLKKFYKEIFASDIEVQDFFIEILESNILQGYEFPLSIIKKKGQSYIDKNGNEQEGRDYYEMVLDKTVEEKAKSIINSALN
ncbi:MAG: DUF669 domain-containing protein [Romboutsia timonensis]|uniref:DUF669 domain-containing protein n=1 Tax=Romboutsia timonensis TaxID=1776391 RepID=UPI002A7488B3|nr:DUF669 domain-containing protein [Romboutsia timonensis]MDY2882572.1 DUF669 domain-containing protein [Romboutsia timonensis]